MEIDGFKSFAHKTTIKFQPGMTGVIGPNGSGKSNIIEALRWVMGEQSAKTLRGGKMVDVIFNGSKDHKPLNRAMVKITLDNSDHYLQSEYTELTITRKLYRNGDSEYLINNRPVRLKDIVDLFMDSGIGRESFSIISQGRVASIFNGQPADRRQIIETVAGVAKYKKNKTTAEKRLKDTTDNLNRVSDIVYEIKERLDPLKEQSALAQDYLEQKHNLDKLDRTKTVRQIIAQRKRLKDVLTKQEQAKQLTDQYDQKSKQSQDQLTRLQEQRRELVRDKDRRQAVITDKVEEIATLKNKQSLSTVKKQQFDRDQKRLNDQVSMAQRDKDDLESQLKKITVAIENYQQQLTEAQSNLNDLQTTSAEERVRQLQERVEDLQNSQVDLMQKLTIIHNEQANLKQNHERTVNSAKQDALELEKSKDQLAKLQRDYASGQEELKNAQDELSLVNQKLNSENTQRQRLGEKYSNTQRDWYQILGNVQSYERQVKSYQSMVTDYSGYYGGVQSVLRNRQDFAGLFGSVSELIEVPAKYTKAIETVLGSQLQQLVVDRQTTGKAIINFLTRKRAGRATILPMDTLRKAWHPRSLASVEGLPGFLGLAGQLIHYDQKFQIIVDHLLSTTVIADNLDHATVISRAGNHQIRVVTLDGQVINASGSMTGGANRHQRDGLLSQKERLINLQQDLKKEQLHANQLEQQVQTVQKALQTNQTVISELQKSVTEKQRVVNQEQTKQEVIANSLKRVESQVQALRYQVDQTNGQNDSYSSQYSKHQQDAEQTQRKLDDVKKQVSSTKRQIADLQTNASSQAAEISNYQQKIVVIKERLHQSQHQKRDLVTQITAQKSLIQKYHEQIQNLEKEFNGKENDTRSTDEMLKKATDTLKSNCDALKILSAKQEELEESLGDLTQENERLHELQRAAFDDLSRTNDEKGRLEANIDQELNRLSERYSMTLEEAQREPSDLPDEEIDRQIKLIKRGLADLGDVNIASIKEYQETSQRYQFLNGQKEDLEKAKQQLQNTMDEMDGQVKNRFITTFTKVSRSFSETFTQIFEGGQAKLVMTDPDDLLTTGVDIMAQPPGKKNQQLSLLSGGEKALTAIALLFAILKVRPVPFAILDEPEAALDDVNVDRFANYLDRFGNTGPQFIVITHRKGTMRNADVLYGVTMQESGISKIVSVDIDETLGMTTTKDTED